MSAAEPPVSVAGAIDASDLIVVGRVVGLVDTKPIAATRREREVHWIDVERTLAGGDEAGQRLRVRPNGLLWEDGRSYVLFLKRGDGDWAEAVTQPDVPASPERIASVEAVLAERGRGVEPRRLVWIRYTGGWGGGLLAEFSVTGGGDFVWRGKADPGSEPVELAGTLPAGETAGLIEWIEGAGPGPISDDAGIVSVRWLDAGGEARDRSYLRPDRPPASELLDRVERLARRYGHGG